MMGKKNAQMPVAAPGALPEYDYEMRQEGRSQNLILHCTACEGPEGILNPRCLAVILKILSTETYTDLITFTGTTQRQYAGQSVELLKRLVQLSKLLDQLGLRVPLPYSAGIVFPDGQIDEVIEELQRVASTPGALPGPLLTSEGNPAALTPAMADTLARNANSQKANIQRHLRRLDCARCAFNPRNLFPSLKILLLSDLRAFALELRRKAQVLAQGNADEGCSRCLGLTVSDLEFLADQLLEFDGFVRSRGAGDATEATPQPEMAAPARGGA